ncbi:hypothetical protein ACH5Y9_05450 [Methylomonas sp. BW4-1]|uniref:hypothetical protein n=1 Tax=Methylomonas sp. BW4-1 TaxID=3376685 RepID=UPI00404301DC
MNKLLETASEKRPTLCAEAATRLVVMSEAYVRNKAKKWLMIDEDIDGLIDTMKRNGAGVSLICLAVSLGAVLTSEVSDD